MDETKNAINWRENWVLFSPASDNDDTLYNLLKRNSISPREFVIYGDIRSLLQALGIDITKHTVMHGTSVIGGYAETEAYLQSLKTFFYI